MARPPMTLAEIMATAPDVDFAKIDATTEEDIRRHMLEEGYDPDEAICGTLRARIWKASEAVAHRVATSTEARAFYDGIGTPTTDVG